MSTPQKNEFLLEAKNRWQRALLAKWQQQGYWEGRLATSALSTAVAMVAFTTVDRNHYRQQIQQAVRWLSDHANADGGWGDTVVSHSNLSTTALCWGALSFSQSEKADKAIEHAEAWLSQHLGDLQPKTVANAILNRYAEDRTFSVPILMMLAVCGCLGASRDAWRHVMPLPFELAALPRRFYSLVGLPVVSYALPALIAIGQTIHHHRTSRNPITYVLRQMTRKRTLKILHEIQPENGGFLEATPLTGFVTISLAAMGEASLPAVKQALSFLEKSQREDGSWPIDTHLATWVSTLATNALLYDSKPDFWPEEARKRMNDWLLAQQYQQIHPYTGAAPGGWAWTPLQGGVPDADDTSGALLALANLNPDDPKNRASATAGLDWLAGLQNRDGGIPTFCKGWGTLPFDQSCADISAHAFQAVARWRAKGLSTPRWERMARNILSYLKKNQALEGWWLPLWFGNQHHPKQHNPTYGTAKVLFALAESLPASELTANWITKATVWLAGIQKEDGSWGGDGNCPATVEETAVSVSALASFEGYSREVRKGLEWLAQQDVAVQPSPIGFYFANLWYFEELYPLVWTVHAFEVAGAKGYLK